VGRKRSTPVQQFDSEAHRLQGRQRVFGDRLDPLSAVRQRSAKLVARPGLARSALLVAVLGHHGATLSPRARSDNLEPSFKCRTWFWWLGRGPAGLTDVGIRALKQNASQVVARAAAEDPHAELPVP